MDEKNFNQQLVDEYRKFMNQHTDRLIKKLKEIQK